MEEHFVCSWTMKMPWRVQIKVCDVYHLLGSVRTLAHGYFSKLQEHTLHVISIYSISPKPLLSSLISFQEERSLVPVFSFS
jgi:hypothetical protein